MTALPPDLYATVREALADRFGTLGERQTILAPLFGWQKPLYRRIVWEGNADEFTARLASLLAPGQLAAVVQEARRYVGDEQHGELAHLSQRLLTLSHDAPPDVLAAAFAAHHQRLIERHVNDPRYQIDARFVRLTLIKDHGPDAQGLRWAEQAREYNDLRLLASESDYPAIALLGAPGGGKTTLLRRMQLDDARDRLADGALRLSFFVPLNRFPVGHDDPAGWLGEEWDKERGDLDLPEFKDLTRAGRALLLLDALNEMPHRSRAHLRERIGLWRDFLRDFTARRNSAVVTCRNLDYSEPLGSDESPVQNANVKPMTPEQVREFLDRHLPERAGLVWQALKGAPRQLELFSTPYFLKLLTDDPEVRHEGRIPAGRAALFTGLVRQALAREWRKPNPLLRDSALLSEDDQRQVNTGQYAREDPHQLPERGALVPALARLAHGMQRALQGDGAQVAIDKAEALSLLPMPEMPALSLANSDKAEAVVQTGVALNLLDDDIAHGQVKFFHQLLQEYFAARQFARTPEFALVRSEWRAEHMRPSLADVLATLPSADPLPPAPATGWEETVLIAAAMARQPDAFVRELAGTNLPLAGRAAAAPDARVSPGLKAEIQRALIARTQDMNADLRARIAAGLALGELGDPRFERRTGPHGPYLAPPLATIPAGAYPIGDDASAYDDEKPAHTVALAEFRIGRFAVTNAEFKCFVDGGGYDDPRWWEDAAAQAWRRGEGQVEGVRESWREDRRTLLGIEEADIQAWATQGRATPKQVEDWLTIRNWSEGEFDTWLGETFPEGERYARPRFWDDPAYNNPAQPVVGVCWFEARAYCAWLAAQTGQLFRLPSEVELEAAARGVSGRTYAYGDAFDAARANTVESHVRRTTPVGVYAPSASPFPDEGEGLYDACGNVWEWTCSAYEDYPYDAGDGREDMNRTDVKRVVRGGAWHYFLDFARAACRLRSNPHGRVINVGFRVVRASPVHPS